MASKTPAAGSVVRAWALSTEGQDFLTTWATENEAEVPTVGSRGKFSAELLAAFHKANPRSRYTVGHRPSVKVSGRVPNSKGGTTPITRNVSPAELREFVKANGGGERGRISADMRAAFAARPKV
jgi:hypothetical protein